MQNKDDNAALGSFLWVASLAVAQLSGYRITFIHGQVSLAVESAMASPVLLFAHGAGFCKEIWAPIIRRMQQYPLLQCTPAVNYVSVDLPFHGSNRDNSVAATVDEKGPHVTHPANDAIALAAAALLQKARELSSTGQPVVGIGHSMGAVALWKAEVSNPGTFKGLVLFEPIFGPPMPNRPDNFMADVTLKREWKWPSRAAAADYFEKWKSFSSWDRESLSSWMEGAIVPEGDAVVLACHPTIEASIYCGGRLWLSEQKQARTKCRTIFHSGSTTRLFSQKVFQEIVGRHPAIFKIRAPMVGRSHLMVLEDPEACAKAIVSDLEGLTCFEATSRL